MGYRAEAGRRRAGGRRHHAAGCCSDTSAAASCLATPHLTAPGLKPPVLGTTTEPNQLGTMVMQKVRQDTCTCVYVCVCVCVCVYRWSRLRRPVQMHGPWALGSGQRAAHIAAACGSRSPVHPAHVPAPPYVSTSAFLPTTPPPRTDPSCLQDLKPFSSSTRLPHQAGAADTGSGGGGLMVPPVDISMADAYTYNVRLQVALLLC